jgi:predicted PurR-regulated permease PerM
VPRVISFLVLLAIILLVGVAFFQVMAQFIVPLFLAAVLVVVFQPLHTWTQRRLPERPRISALVTTVLILLVVLLPLVWLGWKAYVECYAVYNQLQTEGEVDRLTQQFTDRATDVQEIYERFTGRELDTQAVIQKAIGGTSNFLGAAVVSGVQIALGMLVGLLIMVISVYYYLADGPAMIRALMKLSPLDDVYEQELLERFSDISRSVVVATLLSAVVQGVAAGIGYWFALPAAAPIFLLIALTMVFAIVPFIGSATVWVPVCGWIFLYGPQLAADGQAQQGNWVVALVLAGYCGVVVSSADNFIKPYVLHGQANLHPLLALLSILGGVQVLGPIGILVGPMLVSFLQALLNMFQKELASMGKKSDGKPSPLAVATVQAAGAAMAAAAEQAPPPTPEISRQGDTESRSHGGGETA